MNPIDAAISTSRRPGQRCAGYLCRATPTGENAVCDTHIAAQHDLALLASAPSPRWTLPDEP